jgi:glycosyltransferase involved in cell wall biosynthesis
MSARRILVVTYYFAPSTAIGAARWTAMSDHLTRLGHEVTVITSAVHGALDDDAGRRIVRTADLGTSSTLRRLLRRPPLGAPGAAPVITPAPAPLTRVVVPDSHLVSWMPGVLAAARRVLRERPIDCVLTSGPPDSAHLLGLLLGRRRPPWIADFRDGWRYERLAEPWPTRPQRALEARLERAVARGADAVIGATAPIAEDLSRRLGARASWIPNGWDPELGPSVDRAVAPAVDEPGWVTLVHTGTLSGPRGRDPRPLLRALRRANADPHAVRRVRLVLAGRLTTEDAALLAEAQLGDSVRHLGLLERDVALALQRRAEALALLTGRDRSEATGKLFEYLHAGRPILALAQGNEAERIVRSTGTGVCVAPTDEERILGALRTLAAGGLEQGFAPHGLEPFTYPGPAEAVAALVEDAIGHARQGRR